MFARDLAGQPTLRTPVSFFRTPPVPRAAPSGRSGKGRDEAQMEQVTGEPLEDKEQAIQAYLKAAMARQ